MVSAVLTLIFFTVATQAQTARQTMEDVSQTLAAGEKLQTITDILQAAGESGGSESLNAACIFAMDSSVKTTIGPVGSIRRFFGAVADPAFNECVAQFCNLGEGHTSFAKWVYQEQCSLE